MGVTAIGVATFSKIKAFQSFIDSHPEIGFFSGLMMLILIHIISLCSSSKNYILNWVFGLCVTLLSVFFLNVLGTKNLKTPILYFLILTSINFFVLFLYTRKKSKNIAASRNNSRKSNRLGYVIITVITVIVTICGLLIFRSEMLGIALSGVLSMLIGCFYLYDGRLICLDPNLGGKGLCPCFLAFNLHLEFLYLFLVKLVFFSLCSGA